MGKRGKLKIKPAITNEHTNVVMGMSKRIFHKLEICINLPDSNLKNKSTTQPYGLPFYRAPF